MSVPFNCSSLESITIPSSVKKICEWAFFDCGILREVIITGDLEEYTANIQNWFRYRAGYHSNRICNVKEENVKIKSLKYNNN